MRGSYNQHKLKDLVLNIPEGIEFEIVHRKGESTWFSESRSEFDEHALAIIDTIWLKLEELKWAYPVITLFHLIDDVHFTESGCHYDINVNHSSLPDFGREAVDQIVAYGMFCVDIANVDSAGEMIDGYMISASLHINNI